MEDLVEKPGRGLGCQRTYRTTHSGGVFTGETRWSGEWSVRARLGVGVQSGTGKYDDYGPAGRSKRVVGRWAGPGLGSETRRRSSEARTCHAGAK